MNTFIYNFKKQRVCYVLIPKSGCTSMKWSLRKFREEYVGKSCCFQPETWEFHNWFGYPCVNSSIVYETLKNKYKNHFKFVVVRDPVERFLSYYHYCQYSHNDHSFKKNEYSCLSDFVDKFEDSKLFITDDHVRIQTDIIGTDLSVYNHVGVTSRLGDTFFILEKLFNEKFPIIHLNKSKRLETLTKTEMEKIRKIYCQDYEVFEKYNIVL